MTTNSENQNSTTPIKNKESPTDSQTTVKIKRKRKKATPQNETQKRKNKPSPSLTNLATPQKKHKKKKYEIDNTNLPNNLPIIQPLADYLSNNNIKAPTIPKKRLTPKTGETPITPKLNKKMPPQPTVCSSDLPDGGKKVSEESIIQVLQINAFPMLRDEICAIFKTQKKQTSTLLSQMLESGQLFQSKKKRIALPSQVGHVVGKLQVTSRGFGFLIPQDASEDIFLHQNSLNSAMNGDRVVVKIIVSHGSSREGTVAAVLERANSSVVGTVQTYQGVFYVFPDNTRMGQKIRIAKGKLKGATNGQKVVADLVFTANVPTAKVSEILGDPSELGVDILAIVRSYGFDENFDPAVLKAANAFEPTVQQNELVGREDLRSHQIVTIDGADAKDFDDAISCEKQSDGTYLLGVHIADVSHYVAQNTPLDTEALKRSTSVYFVDRVIPMLPEVLSNGICSLNPNVDRLTLSCHMRIDKTGQVIDHKITQSVICSKHRLIYDNVTAALEGDKAQKKALDPILPMLKDMHCLSKILFKRRNKRGSLDFEFPEAKIILDEKGHTQAIELSSVGLANKIIEEFMLVCNETVAQHMNELDIPILYRVHETPDSEKISDFQKFIAGFGLVVPLKEHEDITTKALQSVLKKVSGKNEETAVSKVMLRSLKKARYCEQNLGHFGLAATYYCHFTSPIRRYPDLMVHRILKKLLQNTLSKEEITKLRSDLPEIGRKTSQKERSAMEAERDVNDLKKCEYMAQHLGEQFNGKISGVTQNGLFVELPNTCEGFVRIAALKDDYYTYQEKQFSLVGRNTGTILSLGGKIKIKVVSADLSSRRVEFSIPTVEKQNV